MEDHTTDHQLPMVSVITACYKSVPFLERVYSSIQKAGYPNIEWIAVDDKSPDNTVEKLYELKQRQEIPVKIVPLEKNTRAFGAVAEGIAVASGKFTLILDHDDELIPGSLGRLVKAWNEYNVPGEKLFAVWGRCVNENDELMGKQVPGLPMVCRFQYFSHVLKCREECLPLNDTELLRKYYILKPGETVKTNGAVWAEMARDYRAIFTNEIVRKYYTNIPTSQTNQGKTRMPSDIALQEVNYLNDNHGVFWNDFGYFVKKIMIYEMYCHYAGIPVGSMLGKLNYFSLRFVAVLLLPALPLLLLRERIVNK